MYPDICAQAPEWRTEFICAYSDFTDQFIQKIFSVCMGQDKFLSIDYKGNLLCLLQGQCLHLAHGTSPMHKLWYHCPTTVFLESFWSRSNPRGQPASDVAFAPCCSFVFQQLWRLCLLQRVNDCNNKKPRTSEMAGLMWNVPEVCPLKPVWIFCRERASFQTACFGKAVLQLTWWVAQEFYNKTPAHMLRGKTVSCPDDLLARQAEVGVLTYLLLLSCVCFSPCGTLAHGVGFEVMPCLHRFLALRSTLSSQPVPWCSARAVRGLRSTCSSVTLLLEAAKVPPACVGHV